MPLSATERTRFARQMLLPEIGETGQMRLCAAHARLDPHSDPGARQVAREYLQRAGVSCGEPRAAEAARRDAERTIVRPQLPSAATIDAVAGDAGLREAAVFLSGAFAATETLRALIAEAQPEPMPPELTLGGALASDPPPVVGPPHSQPRRP